MMPIVALGCFTSFRSPVCTWSLWPAQCSIRCRPGGDPIDCAALSNQKMGGCCWYHRRAWLSLDFRRRVCDGAIGADDCCDFRSGSARPAGAGVAQRRAVRVRYSGAVSRKPVRRRVSDVVCGTGLVATYEEVRRRMAWRNGSSGAASSAVFWRHRVFDSHRECRGGAVRRLSFSPEPAVRRARHLFTPFRSATSW